MAVVFKLLLITIGAMLMVLGIVVSWLPGPFGLPIVLLGLILILRYSTWFKRLFMRRVRRHPRLLGPLRALLRPHAKILALMWLNLLRCEKFVFRGAVRPLYAARRFFKRVTRRRRHEPASAA